MLIPVKGTDYPLRLVQITDCHLEAREGGTLLGVDTDESLQDVIDLVWLENGRIDCLLVTGDLASHGDVSAYQRFRQNYLPQLPQPIACLPGNHDDPALMQQELSSLLTKSVEIGDWLLVLLDSRIPNSEFGNLSDDELNTLTTLLEASTGKHVIVFLHHQVLPVGCHWLDRHAVASAPQFVAIVNRFPNVKLVVSGHVHQESAASHDNIDWLTTPSTCVQFKPNSNDFALDGSAPGYRWFDLYVDGRVVTGVSRVQGKVYSVDFASSGY